MGEDEGGYGLYIFKRNMSLEGEIFVDKEIVYIREIFDGYSLAISQKTNNFLIIKHLKETRGSIK